MIRRMLRLAIRLGLLAGVGFALFKVVKEVNGVKIKNLKHLVETLRDSKDKYIAIVFDDKNSETIVFDRQEILKATDEILSDNSVRQQASEDIAPIWSKNGPIKPSDSIVYWRKSVGSRRARIVSTLSSVPMCPSASVCASVAS